MPSEHLWEPGWHLWGFFFCCCSSFLFVHHRLTECNRRRGLCRHQGRCHRGLYTHLCQGRRCCRQRRGRPPGCRFRCHRHFHQCHRGFKAVRVQLSLWCWPFVWLSLPSFCHPLSSVARLLLEAFPSSGVSFLSLWLSLLRSYLRVSLGLLPLLSVAQI